MEKCEAHVGISLGFPRERWTLLWDITISGWPNTWINIVNTCSYNFFIYHFTANFDMGTCILSSNQVLVIQVILYYFVVFGRMTQNCHGNTFVFRMSPPPNAIFWQPQRNNTSIISFTMCLFVTNILFLLRR